MEFFYHLQRAKLGLVKIFALKDEVVIDQKDVIIKVESQKQDKKDLEELEGL